MSFRPDSKIVQGDALTLAVDTGPCESDRVFFRQHPQRSFRLRPAWTIEIEDTARYDGMPNELPDGCSWWMLVHQIVRGKVRLRWLIAAPHDLQMIDPPEKVALDLWRSCIPAEWKERTRDLQREFARMGEAP